VPLSGSSSACRAAEGTSPNRTQSGSADRTPREWSGCPAAVSRQSDTGQSVASSAACAWSMASTRPRCWRSTAISAPVMTPAGRTPTRAPSVTHLDAPSTKRLNELAPRSSVGPSRVDMLSLQFGTVTTGNATRRNEKCRYLCSLQRLALNALQAHPAWAKVFFPLLWLHAHTPTTVFRLCSRGRG